jgi:hypothetical protein
VLQTKKKPPKGGFLIPEVNGKGALNANFVCVLKNSVLTTEYLSGRCAPFQNSYVRPVASKSKAKLTFGLIGSGKPTTAKPWALPTPAFATWQGCRRKTFLHPPPER